MNGITSGKAWFTPVTMMVWLGETVFARKVKAYTHLIITMVRRNIQFYEDTSGFRETENIS